MNPRLTFLLSGIGGGLVAGGLLGLLEAVFHAATSGAPDHLAPLYGTVLYGLLGAGAGGVAGLGTAALPPPPDDLARRARIAFAHALGAVFAVVPMLAFTLRYLGNKVVYAEQGVPVSGMAVIGLVVVGFAVFELTVMARIGRGPGFPMVRPAGAFATQGVLVLVGLGWWLVPAGDDPRAFAHDKPVPAALADAPDVLVLTIDTLRADHLGAYGFPEPISPVLDGIAADGIVFEDASAHASWTRSSFASLWTSRLPTAHRADTKASRLSDDLVLLSETLQAAGMTTGNLANNINVTETFNFDQGYDSFVYEAPDYHFGATESVFSLTFYKVVHKLREKVGGAKKVESFYQPADVVLGDARAFIEANPEARWMLGVHLMEPHDPYFEHPYLDGSGDALVNGVGFARAEVEHPSLEQADYLKRVYADEIRHMDRLIEPFVTWLKESGRYDRTLIVITADHGEEFGEHGGFWHGTTLYEEQTHVPLIVKLPANALAGSRVSWQARLIDVAPTITAALGLDADPSWAGRDLLADVRAEVEEATARAEAVEAARSTIDGLSEGFDAGTLDEVELEELRTAQRLLEPTPTGCGADPRDRVVVTEQDFEGNVLAAVRRHGRKLIVANDGNPRGLPTRELFDLDADPDESADLLAGAPPTACVAQPAEVANELTTVLDAERRLAATGAVQAEDVQVDDGETCNLCALGYLSGPACDDC